MPSLKAAVKAVKKAVAKVKKANINFKRLSPAGKRMAIFADISASLNKPLAKRFKVKRKVYFKMRRAKGISVDASLQALLPKMEASCTVCGIGACFISHVRLANEFKIAEMNPCEMNGKISGSTADADDNEMMPSMENYFPAADLRCIEGAFEGQFYCSRYDSDSYDYSEEEDEAATQWLQIIPSATDRLRAIAENGLRNKGNFNILQLPTKPVRKAKKAVKKATKKAGTARGR